MFVFSREQCADLCALCYFDVQDFHLGMSFEEFHAHAFEQARPHDALYERLRKTYQEVDYSCFTHLRLVNYVNENNQNGLVFYQFEDDEHCFLVYRGSESLDGEHKACGWEDWEDNLEIFLGITHQQLRALKYFNELQTTKPITLMGHSKGGNLALFLSVVCSQKKLDQIQHVIVFNAPGINDDMVLNYKERLLDERLLSKVFAFENEGDPVSSMFHHVASPYILASNTKEIGVLGAYDSHQLWAYKKEKESFVDGNKKTLIAQLADMVSNQWVAQMDQVSKKKMIERLMEYVRSDIPMEQMYHLVLFQLGKRHHLFDEHDDITTIELETLFEKAHHELVKQVSEIEEVVKKTVEQTLVQSKKKVESWMKNEE